MVDPCMQVPHDNRKTYDFTSPKVSMRVTDISIAPQAGRSASRKIGRALIQCINQN